MLAENTALKAELEHVRTSDTATPMSSEVGAEVSNTQCAAQWALDPDVPN